MAISALPEATIHLLGSAQVLTTPTSLIKELIDNSLDAKATVVDILISSNTLDRLEVKDNGHGISEGDLKFLGKRGHTSKLRSFEELKSLGGVTLGFRGEALASAVQLGDVSITTKTEGESVATKVKLMAPGVIEQQTRTSHPIGTTVKVLNFMAKLPVRKKTFEKEAAKTLVKLNRLLRAYALARPSVKFSLKVMNGSKESWSYAPRLNGDIRAAASQVIGRNAALQCVEKTMTFLESSPSEDNEDVRGSVSNMGNATPLILQREPFIIEAFLPISTADPSKLGSGQYLSIDARPVSHEKGTMKKVVTLFKQYLRGSLAATSSDTIKNPFIRLNIKCPIASYDANVEPAKDDVLFENESLVIDSVERLFKAVYGDCKAEPAVPPARILAKKLDNFEILLARKPTSSLLSSPLPLSASVKEPLLSDTHQEPISPAYTNERSSTKESLYPEIGDDSNEGIGIRKPKWGFDMSKDYREEVEGYEKRDPNNRQGRVATQNEDMGMESNPKNALNPWVIAKLNAPVSRNVEVSSESHATSRIRLDAHHPAMSQSEFCSSPTPRPRQNFHNDDIRALQLSVDTSHRAPQYIGNGSSHVASIAPWSPINVGSETSDRRQAHEPVRETDFGPARNLQMPFGSSRPPTLVSKRPRVSRGSNRPFVPPLKQLGGKQIAGNLVQTRLAPEAPARLLQPNQSASDLDWAMDFEHRKETATRQRREEIRTARLIEEQSRPTEVTRSSPHENRYNAAIANLDIRQQPSLKSAVSKSKTPFITTLQDDDPRAYLMRRRKSMADQPIRPGDPPKLMRAKSTKLPMETIPRDGELFRIVQVLPTKIDELKLCATTLLKDDMYTSRGSQAAGLVMSSGDGAQLTERLRQVVKTWVGSDEARDFQIQFDFSHLLSPTKV